MRKGLALFSVLLALLWAGLAPAQIIGSYPFNLTNGTLADATQVMSNFNYVVSQVNANAANNGANSNITAITGLTTPLSASQGGSQVFTAGLATGTANAITVSSGITPINFSLVGKNIACFIASATNTGATTLSYNGTTVTNIFKRSASGPIALQGGEIVTNNAYCAQYDGTQYELLNLDPFRFIGKQVSVASAGTTDLGAQATNNIKITGVTTITAFGSSAQTDYPIYFLQFAGALTLTHNATSLILPGALNKTTAAGDSAIALYLGSGNWQVLFYTPAALPSVNTQSFTTGTAATYTPSAGTVRIRVTLCGGGGGGGAATTNNGTNGNASSFTGSAGGYVGWTANGGTGGVKTTAASQFISGGAGGTGGTDGTGNKVRREPGQQGGSGLGPTNASFGGAGGGSLYNGVAGALFNPTISGTVTGLGALNQTGGGGGGMLANQAASGGGGGECVIFWNTLVQMGATATYTVGANAAGGVAGGAAGGQGLGGILVIEEFPF